MNELYLMHHGIKGQKWGERNAEWYPIAKYEAAKAHDEKKIKKISKINYLKNPENFSKKFNSLGAVRTYSLNKSKDLKNAKRAYESKVRAFNNELDDFNNKANAYAAEKAGGDFFSVIGTDKLKTYLEAGREYAKQHSKEHAEKMDSLKNEVDISNKEYSNLSKKYEQESKEFLTDYLGKYGDLKIKGSVSYNTKTGEIEESKFIDLANIEMLRKAGGRI